MKHERKIAIFGGTFDPIHLGHTKVAQVAAEYIDAEAIIFVPAKRSALKTKPQASDRHRLNMIKLAIKNLQNFHTSDCELKRHAPSFTMETINEMQKKLGRNTVLYWLLGADTIEELPRWFRVLDLIDECNLACMYRAGFDPPDFSEYESLLGHQRVEKLQKNIIKTPLVDISSTEVRERCAAGRDIADLVHPAVAEYIHEHSLYQTRNKH
ncbi:MAG: nicotinate (nicotinamide) nucleotide adenylyltransferase [Planctomycetota bacterium]|jgi:nicotinate-nucleotide adenylyltransferase